MGIMLAARTSGKKGRRLCTNLPARRRGVARAIMEKRILKVGKVES